MSLMRTVDFRAPDAVLLPSLLGAAVFLCPDHVLWWPRLEAVDTVSNVLHASSVWCRTHRGASRMAGQIVGGLRGVHVQSLLTRVSRSSRISAPELQGSP